MTVLPDVFLETKDGPKSALPKPWIKTPCILSNHLSTAAGCQVYTKLEILQPSGSFKTRGIGNMIWQTTMRESGLRPARLEFYSSSRGNAGLAAAVAARSLKQKATVVVPEMTDPKMVARIENAGAEVIVHGASLIQADEQARALVAARPGRHYISPFDHELIWEGNSSIVDEIFDEWEGPPPDAIVCSVGGGGLLNGIMLGLDRYGWADQVNVLALETEGADCLSRSLQADKMVTMQEITSIAKSLGVSTVSNKTWELVQQHSNIRSVVLEDADAARACVRFAVEQRILVEPACGVCLATCYEGLLPHLVPNFGPHSRVVIIVCGGSGVDAEKLLDYDHEYGRVAPPEARLTVDGIPFRRPNAVAS